jgi:hypothetical protein
MPDRYEASARVYVDTQSVLRPLLAGLTIQPNVDQMVAMMSRTLISRPNLEKVVRMADLDIKLKTTEEREALIARLSKSLADQDDGAGQPLHHCLRGQESAGGEARRCSLCSRFSWKEASGTSARILIRRGAFSTNS